MVVSLSARDVNNDQSPCKLFLAAQKSLRIWKCQTMTMLMGRMSGNAANSTAGNGSSSEMQV